MEHPGVATVGGGVVVGVGTGSGSGVGRYGRVAVTKYHALIAVYR